MYLLMLIGWGVMTWYLPIMLCGYNYVELIDIMNNKDARAITEFLKAFNVTESNTSQVAGKYLVISVGLSILILVVFTLFYKLLKGKKA